MKKLISIVMVLALALCLFGCGAKDEGKTPSGDEGKNEGSDFKVGAIYINSKNDTAGYTFAHHQGITAAMQELGLSTSDNLVIVDEVPEDKETVLRAVDTLVGEGCNIIFGISFGYLDALNEAAAEYPDVVFSHATGYLSNDTNFNNYFGRIYQARYLAGIAAGLKSVEEQNDNIGYVAAYGTAYAETCSGINAFTLGAQSVNPNAKMHVNVIGNWADEVLEKSLAQDLIDTYDCCVVAQHCDSAQPQLVAQDNNVFGCGYNSDMTKDAPKAHLTAPVWNWNVYYKLAIETAMNCGDAANFVTKMGGSAYYGGLAQGFVDVSPLTDNCADNTQAIVDAVKELIVSGKWDVFSGKKLSYQVAADGTVTIDMTDAALVDNQGNEIVAAGGASVEDGVITGSMNYYVAGVTQHN